GTLDQETRIVSPAARAVVARTRSTYELNLEVAARNIQGAVTPTGEYVMLTAIEFPTFIEDDTALHATPFIFEGIPWNLDRRVGVGGCIVPCPTVQIPLSAFSISALNTPPPVRPPTGHVVLLAAH